MLFAEVQNHYDIAKSLSEEFSNFLPRFQPIEEKYIELKNISEKIQALEYKPWLQRIKDYLYSLAAVAMILLFLNMLQAKLKALKQARENAIIRKSKFPQNPKRSVRFSGKRTKRSVQKRKARNTQKAETKVL